MSALERPKTRRNAEVSSGPGESWWEGAVIYQIYPRSFMDSNADGVGDLAGIASKLDYVAGLGVDAIWLSPFFPSPMKDFGYDVSDYRSVDAIFGSLDDFRTLMSRAKNLGLKVIIDMVLGHTSDQHPWFQESRRSHDNSKSDWYVWADPKPDGSPPNNWLSPFGGSAWQWDSQRGQYYFHNFLECQPDLNFHEAEVRRAQMDNLRFWLDLGIDGVRLDAVNFYFHDRGLRDNPPARAGNGARAGLGGDNPYGRQQHLYDNTRPENLEFLGDLRSVLDEYPNRTSIGEVFADDSIGAMAAYTQGKNKLHMAYTFDLLGQQSHPEFIRSVIADVEARIGDGWPCWALSNHDVERCVTRWGGSVARPDRFAKVAVALLLSLRGSATLYQGEELGLPQANVPHSRMRDPFGLAFWPDFAGRDGSRTPMTWEESERGGFSKVNSWLPIDERHRKLSVSRQEARPCSVLNATRKFLTWRQQQPALRTGEIELLKGTGDILCWLRSSAEQTLLVALNITERSLSMPLHHELLEVQDGHGFKGCVSDSQIFLEPHQAFFATVRDVC